MKLFYKTLFSTVLISPLCFSANAQQQLPNSDFEGEWVDCIPWTSKNNTQSNGTQPSDWKISHVIGINGAGKTEVGGKTDGYNSTTAVSLVNSANSMMASQIVPSYLTLGTTWSTSVLVSKSDGGTFGGAQFNSRPTGIEFMYKRGRGDANPEEKTTIVAYLWKGHWTQKAVPGEIVIYGNPTTVDMIDRDRCVLGMDMTGCQGGEISKSDDAELIAVINAEITENTSEWTKFKADFDYKSDATPEMINVIIAAGDYFGGATVVGKDNSLIVDDFKLIYAENAEKKSYDGYLNIAMGPMAIATDQKATIEIMPTGDNKCIFTLPNFNLETLGLNLGDIVVENVTISTQDGMNYYEGSVDGLKLRPEGASENEAITANVSLSGTTENMKIDVIWLQDPNDPSTGMPIEVTFTKNPSTESGINDINADMNAPAEYFNLQGMRVNADNMAPGIYVKRQGNKVSKVLVK